jgi:hypothetical protein
MIWTTVEGCCGGRTLKGLGQCNDSKELIPQYRIKQEIEQRIASMKEHSNYAFIQATTVKSQHNANKVLAKMGFIGSGWMKRTLAGNSIQVWTLPLGGIDTCVE